MNANLDRLYNLLPVIYRLRDAERDYPLRTLLGVITEQVDLVEADITQLYENWFIETCQDWVVPYIGELVGYQLIHEAGEPGDINTPTGLARNKILAPRRDVADTIHNRRRKGALALLEELAADVTSWPTRAAEFYTLLGWSQNINHVHLDRARSVDLHNGNALDLIGGPFDRQARTIDLRGINSHRSTGRYNINSVGLFVWRLKTYSVSKLSASMLKENAASETPALCVEEFGLHNYTFSVLGNNVQLYNNSQAEQAPTQIAEELNLPVPIRRRSFEKQITDYYGPDKSLAIWVSDWAGHAARALLPPAAIIPADLSDWHYLPPRDHIAVDPVLGRITFPPSQLPKRNVRVFYTYAFSADIGGGEYDRPRFQPAEHSLYHVGEHEALKRIGDAVALWRKEQPTNAVIEITDSGVYVEQINLELQANQSLQIRATNRKRPVIRLLDWQTDLPDALGVSMATGSRFTLDGLLIAGRSLTIRQAADCEPGGLICPSEVCIRHCTLVPGWGLNNSCEPRHPAKPSLELFNVRARVSIEHSIVGSIEINEDAVRSDPIPVHISDSILDSTGDEREAFGAPGRAVAHALLTIQRSTVFGVVEVHAIELAENSIFTGCVNVARRQLGCMRFCYVPPGCRTPRRYACQPDLVAQAAEAELRAKKPVSRLDEGQLAAEILAARLREEIRVRPQFNSVRYGTPTYCQLAATCAEEIKRGADDESELGAFHDLFQPQRTANLRARVDEYTPAATNAGIIFAS
ncbi:MAG: hypothetical protein ABIV47_18175 [Roseiflexaceae bacterium]